MADPFHPKFVDLVRNYTTTSGTGSLSLSAAVNGFTGIASAIEVGDQFYYSCISIDTPAEREVGRGSLLAGAKVSREPISGTLTDFSKGTKAVALIAAAEWYDTVAAELNGAAQSIEANNAVVAGFEGELSELAQGSAKTVADLSALALVEGSQRGTALVPEEGRGGMFNWQDGDHSSAVNGDPALAIWIAPASDATGASGAWKRVHDILRPEWFGAKGDGVTNDSDAFGAMCAYIKAQNGGAVELRPGATYIVGRQSLYLPRYGSPPYTKYTWAPDYKGALVFENITGPIVVRGNGAKFKCVGGLNYGTFSTVDGSPDFSQPSDYIGDGVGAPYFAMIYANACTGPISIRDIELDGNREYLVLGGGYGSGGGYQIPGHGYQFVDCTGRIILDNINSHHHACDGGLLTGPGLISTSEKSQVSNVTHNDNGRQGLSVTGANGWQFHKSVFNRNGELSSPAAGIDFEGEGGRKVRNISFYDCICEDNVGSGAAIATDSVQGIIWHGGRLVGTRGPAFYGRNYPNNITFHGTTFAGQVTNAHGAKFYDCVFSDDVSLSPTGALYYPLTNMFLNMLATTYFERCRLEHFTTTVVGHVNASTANGGIWNACKFIVKSGGGKLNIAGGKMRGVCEFTQEAGALNASPSYLPGGYVPPGTGWTMNAGTATIESYWLVTGTDGVSYTGPATLDQATGKKVYYASATYDPPSLALGAKGTIQTMTVTGVVLGDKVTEVSFSNDLAGARIVAWVSTANTVSYYAVNENGTDPIDLASGTLRVKVAAS